MIDLARLDRDIQIVQRHWSIPETLKHILQRRILLVGKPGKVRQIDRNSVLLAAHRPPGSQPLAQFFNRTAPQCEHCKGLTHQSLREKVRQRYRVLAPDPGVSAAVAFDTQLSMREREQSRSKWCKDVLDIGLQFAGGKSRGVRRALEERRLDEIPGLVVDGL